MRNVCYAGRLGIRKVGKGVSDMFARITETAMTLLLSLLMVAFFVILAPVWTLFYSSVLIVDYIGAARA